MTTGSFFFFFFCSCALILYSHNLLAGHFVCGVLSWRKLTLSSAFVVFTVVAINNFH